MLEEHVLQGYKQVLQIYPIFTYPEGQVITHILSFMTYP